MPVDLANVARAIQNKIGSLSGLQEWYLKYPDNSKFHYEYYSIYSNIITIDVKSFNMIFLKYINLIMKENVINEFIEYADNQPKEKRVVLFGLLFRELNKYDINLNHYMIAVRNLILNNFIAMYKDSYRSVELYRINYDDIEFSTIHSANCAQETFVNEKFLKHVKFNVIDHIIVLNKKDGVYYMSGNKILDIKYTSGWVNIPIYKTLLTEVLRFIVTPTINMQDMHKTLNEIVEFTDNDQFFGYQDCEISKKYQPTDNVPYSIKNLFIANVMSKFVMLFNRM